MQITTISDTHGLHHQFQLPGGDLLIMLVMFAIKARKKKLQILSIGLKNNLTLIKFLLPETTISFLKTLPKTKFKKFCQKTFSI